MLLSMNADIRTAEHLAALGFDAIDVGFCRVIYHDDPYPHNPMLDDEGYEAILDEYIEKCKKLNLKILTSHIPYRYNYADPTIDGYEYYHNMTCRALKASEYLGAEWAVMHMKTVDETVAYVKRLFSDSGVTRIGIAIENLCQYPIEELIRAHDILASEGYRVGICFDTGHCHINKFYDYDVADTVRMLGNRIKMLHVHDNMRIGDSHVIPYTGSIKWKNVMKALAEIGYEGAFNYEVKAGAVPPDAKEAFEVYCVALGRSMIAMFDEFRREVQA